MGDVPFSEQESCLIPYELNKLDSSDGSFLIHLGDIRDSYYNETLPCPEYLYTNVTSTFSRAPMQTFFIPGERGWLDCPSPVEAYGNYTTHLVSFSNRTDLGWPKFPVNVTRHQNRTELFSFLMDDVLFLGQSLPGPARDLEVETKLRDQLLRDNINWTQQALTDYADQYKAVVVFANNAAHAVNSLYLNELVALATNPDYGEPPFLVLQNGDSFRTESLYENATNVLWTRTDDTVTPLAVTVDPWASDLVNIFKFDRRCYCTFGHRPTRFKTYLPWDNCARACYEEQSQCESVEGCSPPGNTC